MERGHGVPNQILANKKNTMETIADETITSIELSIISKLCQPFYQWNQKKLDKIKREQQEEVEAEKLKKTNQERIFFLYFTTHGSCFSPQTSIYRVRTTKTDLSFMPRRSKKGNQFHIHWFNMHPRT